MQSWRASIAKADPCSFKRLTSFYATSFDPSELEIQASNHQNLEHKAGTFSQLEADDEAEISAPSLDTYTLNPTFTSVYDSDSSLSSQSFNSFFPLPLHSDPSQQTFDSPTMVVTSKWTKFTIMKACKVLRLNVSGFEHEILDIIIRMEEKRKAQILEQRKKSGDVKKGKSKATNELKKLDWGLQDGSGKSNRGRYHKAHSR